MVDNQINLKTTFNPDKIAANLQQQALDVMTDEYLRAVEELQRNSPVGVSSIIGQPSLKESWDIEANLVGGEVVVRITNNAPAALNRLEGRKAGKFPPPIPLQNWVQYKLNQSDPKKIKAIAFLIGRKISKEGTDRSKRNFRDFDPATGKSAPNSPIARAQKRIIVRLNAIKL